MPGKNETNIQYNNSKRKVALRKFFGIDRKVNPKKEALRLAGIYIFLGFIWIFLTDAFLELMIKDSHTLTIFSMAKGWIDVILTGTIVYAIVFITLKRIHQDEEKLDQSYMELRNTYEELEASHEELMASEEELRQQYDSLMESKQQLEDSEERYRLVSEATNDGIWDEQEDIRYFSERWYEITGYDRDELEQIGGWKKLIHPEDYNRAMAVLEEHLQHKTTFYCCEYRMRTKPGKYIWIQARGKALFDENNHAYRVAGSHTDITKLKEFQNKLHYMAYHDVLTALPNRQALYDNNSDYFPANPGNRFVLFFIDMDNFKFINDTMGHDFGDQLIISLSERLVALADRETSLYRIGGDEFVIIVNEIMERENAEAYADKILTAFKEPFQIDESMIHVNTSIGAALFPQHGRDMNELLRCADIAMYKAKGAGGNRYMLYTPSMNEIMVERMRIGKHLPMSLKNKEFVLHYQPQFDIIHKKITGFEALVRWNNQELGLVSPLQFIHIAEETHFIIPLGAWVLNEACAFLKRLHEQGDTEITIAVNISILQIVQDNFVNMVLDVLDLYHLKPQSLELEITESIFMESYDAVINKLDILCSKGVNIALDDFGKGYSSLSYLKQLPISTLKIDKSFIDYISTEERSKPLTGQIVALGISMGMCVIAEGVETKDQLDYLTLNHCQKIQGYLFSKPLPEKEVMKLMPRDIVS